MKFANILVATTAFGLAVGTAYAADMSNDMTLVSWGGCLSDITAKRLYQTLHGQ